MGLWVLAIIYNVMSNIQNRLCTENTSPTPQKTCSLDSHNSKWIDSVAVGVPTPSSVTQRM